MNGCSTQPVRVALANDYQIMLAGIRRLLASDLVEVVELDADVPVGQRVDILLFDTFAKDQNNEETLDELIGNPNVGKVVVYTWNFDPDDMAALLERGVRGCIAKSVGGRQLAELLVRIHNGEVIVLPAPESEPASDDWPGKRDGLSYREGEVAALITQGLRNREISDQLGLSPNSIKSYVRNAYRKMGVESRSQAVLWGYQHGLKPDKSRLYVAPQRTSVTAER